ncbi:MAG: type IV pilus modification protein PilV [Thiotrichales bacterium]
MTAVVRGGLKEQRGVTLTEVLVTILILTIGLLGMANLQVRSLRSTLTSELANQANGAVTSITERMRANSGEARNGDYNINLGETPEGAGLALSDLQAWKDELGGNLPSGDGAIDCDLGGVCTVIVRWTLDAASGGDRQLQMQVLL